MAYRLSISNLPFEWRTEGTYTDEVAQWLATRLIAEDMNSVLVVPAHDAFQNRGVVLLLGKRNPLDSFELATMAYLSKSLYEHLLMLTSEKARPLLSERERECLQWTARGKTNIEIALILGLSEHTVNHYLNSASAKLGSVNRTQAVAVSLRHGWID